VYLGINVWKQYDEPVAVEWSNLSRESYDRTWRFARLSYAFGLPGRSLKKEAAYSFKTLVFIYQSTKCIVLQVRDILTIHEFLNFTHIQTRYWSTNRRTNMRALEQAASRLAVRMGVYG
jgi:hypothetical protein